MSEIEIIGKKYPCTINRKYIKKVYFRYRDGSFIINIPFRMKITELAHMIETNQIVLSRMLARNKKMRSLNLNLGAKIILLDKEYTIIYGDKPYIDDINICLRENALTKDIALIAKNALIKIIPQKIAYYYDIMYSDSKYPSIVYRNVKSYFGQYNARKHQISFNIGLAFNRIDLIDYVIVHELAHIRYLNHKPEFYKLITNVIPNAKTLQKELKREGILL